jgi:hypothetical protein
MRMRKVLGFILIAFALVAGMGTFVTVNPHQAFACDNGDKRGS